MHNYSPSLHQSHSIRLQRFALIVTRNRQHGHPLPLVSTYVLTVLHLTETWVSILALLGNLDRLHLSAIYASLTNPLPPPFLDRRSWILGPGINFVQ
jgi:hypothetical protein